MFVVGFLLALEPLSTEVLTRTHEVVMMYFSISYLRQRALLICNGYLIHSLPIQPVVLETRGRGGGEILFDLSTRTFDFSLSLVAFTAAWKYDS